MSKLRIRKYGKYWVMLYHSCAYFYTEHKVRWLLTYSNAHKFGMKRIINNSSATLNLKYGSVFHKYPDGSLDRVSDIDWSKARRRLRCN